MLLCALRPRALRVALAVTALAAGTAARAQVPDTVPLAPVPTPPVEPLLDPASPLAALPDLGIAWPEIAAAPVANAATATKRAAEAGGEQRYGVTLTGTEGLEAPDLKSRFDAVSLLYQGEGKPANAAQIERRARADADSLRQLLRGYGYYDAEVETRVEAAPVAGPGVAPRLEVTLTATAGALYRFATLSVTGLDAAGVDAAALREAFTVKNGDAVNADRVTAALAGLRTALGSRGYVFAKVGDPAISVDHDTHAATLALDVTPAGSRRFGRFELRGKPLFTAAHLADIARIKPGVRINAARIEDLRRALISTGLVSVVELTPVATDDPDVADIAVRLEPAPPRTVAAELGYGTGEGARVEVSWQHRNLIKPEGAVTLRGVLGTQEQLASATFRRGNFGARDRVINAQIAYDHTDYTAYDAKTFTLAANIERQTNIIFQKKWTWSYGAELDASDETDVSAATGLSRRRTFFIAALPGTLAYDGSDDLLNPTRGYRLSGRVSPEASLQGSVFGYVKLQLDASGYVPLNDRLTFAGRLRFGSIAGASRDRLAPSRRFYAGGGGSVRGYGYQDIGPRDADNDPLGGTSLAEFAIEARYRFGNFGIVPFFDGGNVYSTSLPRISDGLRYGAGLGVRYYTSFGPIRVDVGTPINRQAGDSRVAVYVSLGQAF